MNAKQISGWFEMVCTVGTLSCQGPAARFQWAANICYLLQCQRPCSAARAKRAVRGGCGPVSGVWRLGLTGPVLSFLLTADSLRYVNGLTSFCQPLSFSAASLGFSLPISASASQR